MKFTIPQAEPKIARTDGTIGGSDICFRGGDLTTTAAGDWALVSGVDAARQSAERELTAPPGSLPYRPTWGGGVGSQLFKGLTKATRDQIESAARSCLLKNPRIKRVTNVATTLADDGQGTVLRFDADAVDGRVSSSIPLRPTR